MTPDHLAPQVMERLETLGRISDESGRLTRTFASPAMRRANELVAEWMRNAGMMVRNDALGNLIGHYPAQVPHAKTLLLGSHLDTVRDAGKFDGPLGVLVALACVQHLHAQQRRLPFALEVVAFADEEGVRFYSTYLGSRALAGTFDERDLKRVDADGISMAEAIRAFGGEPENLSTARHKPEELLGYVEVHMEQGPVLEQAGQAVGIVTAIAGQTRARLAFNGRASHAGTTPLAMRRDALCAAAEFILKVETLARKTAGLVATVGQIQVEPDASNVIPGLATLSLDVRHADDVPREVACRQLHEQAQAIADLRGVTLDLEIIQQTLSVKCSPEFRALLTEAAQRHQPNVLELASGAGHDAAALSAITPVGMLFVRCRDGLSHHPDESVQPEDVHIAIAVMLDFLELLAQKHERV